MRLRIHRDFLLSRLGLALIGASLGILLIGAGIFIYYWFGYGRMIDQRLAGHMYQTSARVYSAPDRVFDGEVLTPAQLVSQLQHDGYNETKVDGPPVGTRSKAMSSRFILCAILTSKAKTRCSQFCRWRRQQYYAAR